MKLREVVDEEARALPVRQQGPGAPMTAALRVTERLVDAEVISTCKTCGGIENHEGDCNACGATGVVGGKPCPNCDETGRGPWVPCPACKVWVIAAEAWEVFKILLEEYGMEGGGWSVLEEKMWRERVLQALLPGARVAKDMGVRVRPGHMNIPVEGENERPRFLMAVRGDTIAILEEP